MKELEIQRLQAWAAFKLTPYRKRHQVRAQRVTAWIVKGQLTSPPEEARVPLYREIIYWSDTQRVVSSQLDVDHG